MSENVIQKKSYDFSIKIIQFYKYLAYGEKEWIIGKQLLRSGTSIGANVEEAIGAQSRKDFIAKLSIAYKEARETCYWIRLVKDTVLNSKEKAEVLLNYSNELTRIISAILLSTKKNGP